MAVGTPPFAVSHDDALAVPPQHLVARGAGRGAVDERQPPFQWCAGLVRGYAVEPGERALPPAPVLAEEAIGEGLDQIGHDDGARRPVEEHDLVHDRRAPEPGLVQIGLPFHRRDVGQGLAEPEIAPLVDRRRQPPDMRGGIAGLPVLKIEMMDLVGADEVSDAAEPVDLLEQARREPDRRPDPEITAVEPDDHGARRVGEPVEAHYPAFREPDRVTDFFECHS